MITTKQKVDILQINLIKIFLNNLCLFQYPQAVYFLIHIERWSREKRKWNVYARCCSFHLYTMYILFKTYIHTFVFLSSLSHAYIYTVGQACGNNQYYSHVEIIYISSDLVQSTEKSLLDNIEVTKDIFCLSYSFLYVVISIG